MTDQDKKIRDLLKGNFDEPVPSPEFTESVMANIVAQEVVKEQKEFEYVPVISRPGWILIGLLFLTAAYLGLTSDVDSKLSALNYIPDWRFDTSVIHSQIALLAVLSILTLLIIDRLLIRFKLG